MTTEEKIIYAAEQIFMEQGFDGARMQAIADKAEINKAMLHYYFRSKDMLFEKIFVEKVKVLFPAIGEQMKQHLSFIDKVCFFIKQYYQILNKYPFLPFFVISTVNKKDNQHFIQKLPIEFFKEFFLESFFQDQAQGKIRPVNPFQFALSLMGMSVFPFLAKPALVGITQMSDGDFTELMNQRVVELQTYAKLILTP